MISLPRKNCSPFNKNYFTFCLLGILLLSYGDEFLLENGIFYSDLHRDSVPSLNNNYNNNPYSKVFEDLGFNVTDEVIPSSDYNILGKLRENDNEYIQTWTPW